ncbi:glycoside hydrolase [Clavulina sp. PMI_390]|nr:glycoside hydrolase [Clavulina sp. PMI_390]
MDQRSRSSELSIYTSSNHYPSPNVVPISSPPSHHYLSGPGVPIVSAQVLGQHHWSQPLHPYPSSVGPVRSPPSTPFEEKYNGYAANGTRKGRGRRLRRGSDQEPQRTSPRRRILVFCAAVGVIILAIVIVVPILVTRKSGQGSNNYSIGGDGTLGSGPGESPPTSGVTSGGYGSTITTEKNVSFTYRNAFGGVWVMDPNDPFSMNARAQSWVPPLNQPWDFATNRIFGVNLGGWLVLEPLITPAYFEKYNTTKDEWGLAEAIAADPSSGGLEAFMTNHYDTFITEEDFAAIATAGLSWVRIPIPFWVIEVRGGEPFLPKVPWTYFLKALEWARKYGIRINLDLHTIPGSQNGFNHSGRLGVINFLNGTMGIANAQRAMDYIRIITEFISQPQYKHVTLWSFLNEPVLSTIGRDILSHFYLEAHDTIRNITGIGAGQGPYISFQDSFLNPVGWQGYMEGADRLVLDSHPYLCFANQVLSPLSEQLARPCQAWGASFNQSQNAFGVTVAGEWALSFNDCGLWLNGIGLGSRWEGTFPGYSGPVGGSCANYTDWPDFTAAYKNNLLTYALNTMDALPHWFFWTWKIGNSSVTGKVEAPMWSYTLGLEQGWIPQDPRVSQGACAAVGISDPWNGTYLGPYNTGGPGAGTINATFVQLYSAWPPSSLSGVSDVAYAPTYTPTGPIPTLPPPAYTLMNGSVLTGGSGWFNRADTAKAMVNVSGCTYPDPWAQTGIPLPTTTCGRGNSKRKRYPEPVMTAPPVLYD